MREIESLTRDLVSMTEAVEALEDEIVAERTKAINADRDAAYFEAEYKAMKVQRDRLQKDLDALSERNVALVEERDELKEQVQSLQLSDAADALSAWLVENGYPSRPLRVDCPRLQRLVDAVGR